MLTTILLSFAVIGFIFLIVSCILLSQERRRLVTLMAERKVEYNNNVSAMSLERKQHQKQVDYLRRINKELFEFKFQATRNIVELVNRYNQLIDQYNHLVDSHAEAVDNFESTENELIELDKQYQELKAHGKTVVEHNEELRKKIEGYKYGFNIRNQVDAIANKQTLDLLEKIKLKNGELRTVRELNGELRNRNTEQYQMIREREREITKLNEMLDSSDQQINQLHIDMEKLRKSKRKQA